MKIPLLALQNKQRGRQFYKPGINDLKSKYLTQIYFQIYCLFVLI